MTVILCISYNIMATICIGTIAVRGLPGKGFGGPGSGKGSTLLLNKSASCSTRWLDSNMASADKSSSVTKSTKNIFVYTFYINTSSENCIDCLMYKLYYNLILIYDLR